MRQAMGWAMAGLFCGLWLGGPTAEASGAPRVECKSFYQDFPNGLVGPNRVLQKADELSGQVDPWLEEQLGQGATGVVLHSFIPFANGSGLLGGAEMICVSFPAG